jgi:exosortase A-associated hydrolase 2
MKESLPGTPAKPFFLKTDIGKRFCLYHSPRSTHECHGALIYIHPFGDEMNKARRMAAMQARTFAASGFGVLQIDLFGCGDSSGEFREARWDIWKRDLEIARKWVEDRTKAPVGLWGLRLGALLALDFAKSSPHGIYGIILWQPVISGESFLTQFLRLQLANEMLAGGQEKKDGTNVLRGRLAAGEILEVAGYELAPELAANIDGLKAAELPVKDTCIHWFEVVAEEGRTLPPSAKKVVNGWEQHDIDLHMHLVTCLPFWATQEISECAQLIAATTKAYIVGHDK